MAELGFLGLGTMGAGMARRLVDAGHTVTVWNRSPEAASDLVAAGAVLASSPAEALGAGISFSMLANDAAADAVLSPSNLAAAAGGVHVNMATISSALADTLAARALDAGVAYLAAPVLGRPSVAAEGQLNILIGGDAATLARVEEYLLLLGKRLWPVGTEPRTANVVKIAVNYDIIHALQAIGESVALVEAHGVDAGDFTELLSSTLFGGAVYTGYGDIIAHRKYLPAGLTVELGLKDLSLAEAAAAERDLPLASAPLLRDAFELAIAETPGYDWAAIAEVSRRAR